MKPIRLAIRVYIEKALHSEECINLNPKRLDGLLPKLAEKHAALIADKGGMIEIEFLDEPDLYSRFLRIGTDPSGMVMPIAIDVKW
jgi:hypothetical protein